MVQASSVFLVSPCSSLLLGLTVSAQMVTDKVTSQPRSEPVQVIGEGLAGDREELGCEALVATSEELGLRPYAMPEGAPIWWSYCDAGLLAGHTSHRHSCNQTLWNTPLA